MTEYCQSFRSKGIYEAVRVHAGTFSDGRFVSGAIEDKSMAPCLRLRNETRRRSTTNEASEGYVCINVSALVQRFGHRDNE